MARLVQASLLVLLFAAHPGIAGDDAPLLVRARNFLVPPSTGPVTHVLVKNQLTTPYLGTLRVSFPGGWEVTPAEYSLELGPGETKEFAFTIQRAVDVKANSYQVGIVAEGDAGTVVSDQTVVCASAPYSKPTIDGDLAEWEGSIPITLTTGEQEAVVRAYWNRREFCLGVEVEELALTDLDAVQFALSKPSATGGYEFAVAQAGTGERKCFLLRTPEQEPGARSLDGLEVVDAQVAVSRAEAMTCYEVAIPFALMRDLRPAPGRELCFSLLVHDPDETGVRDLGEAMNLWAEHRRPGAWCSWDGADWGDVIPYDSQAEFGLCSSVE